MANPGTVQVDPVTGRPVGLVRQEQDEKTGREQEALLREQAAWMAVSKTEAGAKLVAMVMQQITKRIDQLIEDDPEASAYRAILREMGVKEGLAKTAAKELFRRYVKEE